MITLLRLQAGSAEEMKTVISCDSVSFFKIIKAYFDITMSEMLV